MTAEKMNTKVRFVLCPKCRLLLPELPEISVYKCGGCNTVLQAKHSKPDIKAEDNNHEPDENGIKDADSVSDFTLSNKDASISAINESSSPNTSRTYIISDYDMDMNMKQQNEDSPSLEQKKMTVRNENNSVSNPDSGEIETIHSNDFPISSELTSNEMEDSSSQEKKNQIEHDKDDTVSNQDFGKFERRLSNEFPISTELTYNENDTDQYTEADETKRPKMKRDYFESSNFSDDDCSVMLDSSSPECKTHEHNSSIKEGVLDLNLKDSPNVLEDTDNQHDLDHLRAEDLSDHHLPVVESSTELFAKNPKDFTKSPTRSYYARDGSVSSSDGMDDQVLNRSSKPPRRKLKPSNGTLKRAESELPSLLSSENDTHYHHGYNDDLMSSETEIQHLSRKATFLEAKNKDNMSRVPSNRYNERDSALHNVPNKLELLKMINDLKDDLNRTRISNLSFPARFAVEEKQNTWPYHHHESAPTDALYADFPQRPRFSRMAFSGEATSRANCTCLTQDRYFSRLCTYKTHCLANNNHHQFLEEQETMSRNIIRIPTEKDRSSKRYLRPEAGGIPVLSCYHCSELLHLPADFLFYGKKCHKLRCNKCRKIMKFSLENGRHLIPYTPNDIIAPPPSMVNDCNPNLRKHGVASSIDQSSSIKSERLARVSHQNLKHGNMMNKRNLTFDQRQIHTRRKNSMVAVGSSGRGNGLKEAPSTSGGGVSRALHRLMGYASPSQVIRGKSTHKQ